MTYNKTIWYENDVITKEKLNNIEEGIVQALEANNKSARGITNIVKTSSEGLVDTYTITYSDDSTSSFEVTNGEDGENGHSPEIEITKIEGGHRVVITSYSENELTTQEFEIMDGADGSSGEGGASVAVINNLESTDTASALSANQGRVLNEKVTGLGGRVTALENGEVAGTAEFTTLPFEANGYFCQRLDTGLYSHITSTKTHDAVFSIESYDVGQQFELILTCRTMGTSGSGAEVGVNVGMTDGASPLSDATLIRAIVTGEELHDKRLIVTKSDENEKAIVICTNTETSSPAFNDYAVQIRPLGVFDFSAEVYDVTAFGAAGDGVTDDTLALEQVFYEGAKHKKAIFFPAGEYLISRSLPLKSDMEIYGKAATIRKIPAVTTTVSQVPENNTTVAVASTEGFAPGQEMFISNSSNKNSFGARHISIGVISKVDEANKTIYFTSRYTGIKKGAIKTHAAGCYLTTNFAIFRSWGMWDECSNCYIHDLTLDGNAQPDECSDWHAGVIHIDATTGTLNDIPYTYDARNNRFENLTILNSCHDGISDQGAGGAIIENCTIKNSRQHGIHFGTHYDGGKVINCTIEDCGQAGVFWCQNVAGVIVNGNHINGCNKGCSDIEFGTQAGKSIITSNIFKNINETVVDFSDPDDPNSGGAANWGDFIISNNLVYGFQGTFVKCIKPTTVAENNSPNNAVISNNIICDTVEEVNTLIDVTRSEVVIIGNIAPSSGITTYVAGTPLKSVGNSWD